MSLMKGEHSHQNPSHDRPNILLITTDQQRFDTINAWGNSHIYTPHLNWLVDEGVSYKRCYADNSLCMPSRATIMTGKYAHNHGLVGNNNDLMPLKDNLTLPSLLTRNGYQTRAQGKMHFYPIRANYGFEHVELPIDYYRAQMKKDRSTWPKQHGLGENEMTPAISTVKEQDSSTHWTVERSIDFLESRDPTRPFFLWSSFTKPHPPFDPCENYWSLYRDKEVGEAVIGEWAKDPENFPKGFMAPSYMLNNAQRFTKEDWRNIKRAYYACITQVDYSLGLLFARMREMNLLENTWIIFTSDHGEMLGDHGMGGKTVFLEGASHVPLIIRPPSGAWKSNSLQGTENGNLVCLADLFPTIANLASIEFEESIDGKNLIEKSNNSAVNVSREELYGNCSDLYFGLTTNTHKFTWCALGQQELCFDLKNDPEERVNLCDSPDHKEIVDSLRERLFNYMDNEDQVDRKRLLNLKAPTKNTDVHQWPGFHSLSELSDVLH